MDQWDQSNERRASPACNGVHMDGTPVPYTGPVILFVYVYGFSSPPIEFGENGPIGSEQRTTRVPCVQWRPDVRYPPCQNDREKFKVVYLCIYWSDRPESSANLNHIDQRSFYLLRASSPFVSNIVK